MPTMTDAIEALARHVTHTRFADLSSEAVMAAKTFFLDTLGVCLAGTRAPYAASVRTTVSGWGSGSEATVLGLGHKLPATSAAMVNAFHTHSQEYDCVHEAAVVHPLTTIQSAVLAYAERCGGLSGQSVILALALGVDVATCIGMAAQTGLTFFRPATGRLWTFATPVRPPSLNEGSSRPLRTPHQVRFQLRLRIRSASSPNQARYILPVDQSPTPDGSS